jgi:polyhydroxyalkanoate synthesis repressor PhaR
MLLGFGMQQERVIRKYTNRRLYDTAASRHVTLDDLRQLIVAGEKIKVVDDKSGEDLTRAVLLQIISEQEQFGMPVLGTELLETIIRFYGGPMQALLSRYLGQAFTSILRQQEAMQSEMAKALQAPFAPLTELARKNMEIWNQVQTATREAFTGAKPAPSGETPPGSDTGSSAADNASDGGPGSGNRRGRPSDNRKKGK